MATRYSDPFRRFVVKDPRTGKQKEFIDRKKAYQHARELVRGAREKLSDVLTQSKYLYCYEYPAVSAGRGRRVNTRSTTRPEFDDWVASRRAEESPSLRRIRGFEFEDAVTEWLEVKEQDDDVAPETLRAYGAHTRVWVEHFGKFRVCDITKKDVAAFFRKRRDGSVGRWKRTDEPRPASNPTINKDRVLLRAFFGWARKEKLCDGNPTVDVKRRKEDDDPPRVLTAAEVRRLLDACRQSPVSHLYGIVLTALHTLLRFKNVINLRWGQIDLKKRTITVPATETKTRKGLVIEMTPTLHRYFCSLTRGAPSALVFGGVKEVRKSFRSAVARAKLSDVGFHGLRKTGATLLLDADVPLPVVMRMGGWKDPAVLIKIYAGVTKAGQAKAIKTLDGLG